MTDISHRKNYYLGQTVKQLRDGFGVYYYSNKFFHYEGDWSKGKKHGHGKLMMGDGSYYEGEFKEEEIEGHGFRRWAHNGNSYSGEFSRVCHYSGSHNNILPEVTNPKTFNSGEMHGHGVMNYADGSQYQGEFNHNQREGQGVLTASNGEEYMGGWHDNKKHGEGIQSFPNGDEYEGGWVDGCRHGNGELNCSDGSIYEGQWRADLFNGQGSIVHASGFTYDGMWLNGRPEIEAIQIVIKLQPGQKHIEVPQGKTFDIQLEILDENGKPVVGQAGREFAVTAGYRSSQSKPSSLLKLIDDIESAATIPTPFGYDVEPYPLNEYFKEGEQETSAKKKLSSANKNQRVFGVADTIPEAKETPDNTKQEDVIETGPDETDGIASSLSGSKYAASETQLDASTIQDEEFSSRFPPPSPQRSSHSGLVEFNELILPAAPASYKPYLEDEAKVTGESVKSSSSVRSSTSSLKGKKSKGSRNTSASSSSASVNEAKSQKKVIEEKGAKQGKSPRKKSREREKIKSSPRSGSRNKKAGRAKSPPEEPQVKQDPMQEEMNSFYAFPGEYVVIIHEVTQPLFLGTRLSPAFLLVKITPPHKAIKKLTGKRPG